MSSGNGNGRGNGRWGASFADFDFEEVRAALWEYRRCRVLSQDPVTPRLLEGESFVCGCTESRLMLAIDFGRMLDQMAKRLSEARQQRIEEWLSGTPIRRFGKVEQTQLKDDLKRIYEMAVAGGYRYMFTTYNMSAVGS